MQAATTTALLIHSHPVPFLAPWITAIEVLYNAMLLVGFTGTTRTQERKLWPEAKNISFGGGTPCEKWHEGQGLADGKFIGYPYVCV